MNLEQLIQRAENQCELCKNNQNLTCYEVSPRNEKVVICDTCENNLADLTKNTNHWQCLNESIWSQVPAVSVLSYRILKNIENESFAREILDIAYLDEDMLLWANEGLSTNENQTITKDSNGVTLSSGDSVSIIKDLDVKGAGFTAKRGTTVKNISLLDTAGQIEGRVNGVKIVLLSKFLKKI